VEVSEQVSHRTQEIVARGGLPAINTEVAIYEAQTPEVLLFNDSILVKEQKAHRDKIKTDERSRVNISVLMLETPEEDYVYLTEAIDGRAQPLLSLAEVARAKIIEVYGASEQPLNLVAITDGARGIRLCLSEIFETSITLILDWYHLERKVTELMSMIACTKADKEQHVGQLLFHLWRGDVGAALTYLRQVQVRNVQKQEELIHYLEKHAHEIIDYECRQKAGKTIGSGRMEKGCDQVIGNRQKKKGMSWRALGSKSLAILKVMELNKQWKSLWFPAASKTPMAA